MCRPFRQLLLDLYEDEISEAFELHNEEWRMGGGKDLRTVFNADECYQEFVEEYLDTLEEKYQY